MWNSILLSSIRHIWVSKLQLVRVRKSPVKKCVSAGLAVLCPLFTNLTESFPTLVKNTLLPFKDFGLYTLLSDHFVLFWPSYWEGQGSHKK